MNVPSPFILIYDGLPRCIPIMLQEAHFNGRRRDIDQVAFHQSDSAALSL